MTIACCVNIPQQCFIFSFQPPSVFLFAAHIKIMSVPRGAIVYFRNREQKGTHAQRKREKKEKEKNGMFFHSAACLVLNVKAKCHRGKLCQSSRSKVGGRDGCLHKNSRDEVNDALLWDET